MPLLEGKTGIVFGVANKRSIAWAIAQAWAKEGAKLAFTYQGERVKENVEELAGTFGADTLIMPCDVTKDEDITRVFAEVGAKFGKLNLLLHSVAFAPKAALEGHFVDTSREAYLLAHNVSAYSLVALARAGDRKKVDLLVGDLYRPGEIALDPSLTASNFGKQGLSRDPRDLVNAAVGLLGENVALMAGAMARALPGRKKASFRPTVVYAGTTLRHHDVLREILADVTALAGAEARFLPAGEFTGALGALARAREA